MFDIVIPSKATPIEYLKTCFDSLLSQTVQDWHCYVVSVEEIPQEIKTQYPEHKFTWLIQDADRKFAAGARNQGSTAGSNPYIAFLDADDYWYEHHLASFLPYLDSNEVFYHTAFEGGEDYELSYVGGRYLDSQHVLQGTAGFFYRDTPVWPTTLVVPRCHFETVSGFDERLPVLEDTDLGLRLSLLSDARPQFIDEITAYHLEHADSLVNKPDDFFTMAAISDWNRRFPSLTNAERPANITPIYWEWLRRMSGARELKGVERMNCCGDVPNRRSMDEFAFFYASPLAADNPDWQHLMTTEDEEWAFLEDL